MRSVPVRVTLLILVVAATAAAGYVIWTSEAARRASANRAAALDTGAVAATRGLLELRAAQHAYVAAGQGEEFWIERAGAGILDLKASIGGIRAHATSPRAQAALDNALGLLNDFEEIDARARQYARGGQRLIASDLIFSDGLELTAGAIAALDEARLAERETDESLARDLLRTEVLVLGSYPLFAVFVVALLVPLGERKKAPPRSAVIAPPAGDAARAAEPLDLALKLEDEPARPAPAPASEPRVEPPAPAAESAGLDVLAAICTELARVADTRALPSILERAAEGLNASGIIIWIADPDGRELNPVMSHGYSQQLLSRLGTIGRNAQNATAAAYRTGLLQTVRGDATSNGAIAAPLVSPAGTVGVMAAEVRDEGETRAERLAAATIVAAQLATLVGPPVPRAQPKADIAHA
jgi:GAF domain